MAEKQKRLRSREEEVREREGTEAARGRLKPEVVPLHVLPLLLLLLPSSSRHGFSSKLSLSSRLSVYPFLSHPYYPRLTLNARLCPALILIVFSSRSRSQLPFYPLSLPLPLLNTPPFLRHRFPSFSQLADTPSPSSTSSQIGVTKDAHGLSMVGIPINGL